MSDVEMPPITNNISLIDYEVKLEDQKWCLYKERITDLDIEPK